MSYCFGCKHLQLKETKNMLYGWWECRKQPPNAAMVGEVGGFRQICFPPVRLCDGGYE